MADYLADHRQELIMTTISARGECRTKQLAEQLQSSEMTLRRDLAELEKRGLLRRVHGGAVLLNRDVDYAQRQEQGQAQKQWVGRAATRLLKSGQTVYLDAGTTAQEMARAIAQGLPEVSDLSIVTHSISIASELAGRTPYQLQLIGGEIYQNAMSTVGPVALAQIANLHLDVFFLAPGAVDAHAGWTNSNMIEAMVKRAVVARSKSVVSICDSAKWGQESFATIGPLDGVSRWVVDRGLAPEAVAAAKAADITLIYADGM